MKSNALAVMFALIAVAMWSTVATAFKLSLQWLSVLQLLTGACFFSVLVLGICLIVRRELLSALTELPKSLKTTLLLAMLNPVLYYIVLLQAYAMLPAQVAQSINYTWAITLTLLSVPMLGHRLIRADIVAIILGYIGVVCIAYSGKNIAGELNFLGIFLALFSTIIWAVYWLINARDSRPPLTKLFQSFLLALPVLLVITGFRGELLSIDISWQQLAGMAYIGLFEMGLAFMCWQLAMHHAEQVSRISTLIFLSPFVSLFIINRVLGEPLQTLTFLGLTLIVTGILYQQYAARRD